MTDHEERAMVLERAVTVAAIDVLHSAYGEDNRGKLETALHALRIHYGLHTIRDVRVALTVDKGVNE